MKNIKIFLQEGLKIGKNYKHKHSDQWILVHAPAWSNYSYTENENFKKQFKNRVLDVYEASVGIWMQMVLLKTQELNIFKNIFNYKHNIKAWEIPEQDSISADSSEEEIKNFVNDHDHKKEWNLSSLNEYKY